MPTPVSVTVSVKCVLSASALSSTRPPSGVNFIALDSRFDRICCSFTTSWRSSGMSGARALRRSMFFFSAIGRNIVNRPSHTS